MTDRTDVFLSYSRNDRGAAANLHGQLAKLGLSVFWDEKGIREGDLWLDRLQDAVDGCGAFVVLVGRDGVGRWIGAETQAALNRYFGPRDDARRLPIFPILLAETMQDTLPAFVRLFQATSWNGADPLPDTLFDQIRNRLVVADTSITFEGCPFVGLDAYRMDQAQLFFGRQKETLDALNCFFDTRPGSPTVRWLEINGNSGSGKSSLMNAGLLPLVEKGWLWRPRTGLTRWRRIGPMMLGAHPVEMLAEHLARTFNAEMADVRQRLEVDDRALAHWLRSRKPDDETAFLLAVDQFEELFTFADPEERGRFDRLLATALEDPHCPLFIISTVRLDFLDRFDDLPRLVAARNRLGRPWTLPQVGADGLREIIDGPARLAGLDASAVREAMVAEARDEPGALPLVENALHWLWTRRDDGRLSGKLFTEHGGLAGILSRNADRLLHGLDPRERDRALNLLFRMVEVDPEGRRHTRRRIAFAEAEDIAGGGDRGRALITRLAGERARDGGRSEGPLRLITVTEEPAGANAAPSDGRWVNLIHETLIRSKGLDAEGKPQPYWPTLWSYIEKHGERAVWREKLQSDIFMWLEKQKAPGFRWSHERVRELRSVIQQPGPHFPLNAMEQEFLGPIDIDVMLAALDKFETPHKDRLLIGERLDVLGEHTSRWGVGVDANGTPQIDWCPIEVGEATIAILSEATNPLSDADDTLPRAVNACQIARYPITVAQYRTFIEAEDGWCNPVWWGDELYRDVYGNTYEFGRFGNLPAVYVSWFDAVAFCRWLSRRLGTEVRLPDEWEWQHAATGGDNGRIFPWGAHWDAKQEPWRANTFDSQLCQATAVGTYPAGACASTGIMDMAGTVWEWCLNKFETPQVTLSSSNDFDLRVVRGGSWLNLQVYARSAFRSWGAPDFRYGDYGFRVVCSSPSSATDP